LRGTTDAARRWLSPGYCGHAEGIDIVAISKTIINREQSSATVMQYETGTRRTRPCRIAHLHSTLGVYGAERWTFALVKYLDAREFESVVVSVGTKPGADSFYRMLKAEGIAAFHIAVPGRINPRAVWQLRRLLELESIDILHTHGFKSDVLGYLATRNLAVRLVSTLHGWTAHEGLRVHVYEAISRWFLRRFDRIYPLSPALLEQLRREKFNPLKLRLIRNAVDLSPFEFRFNIRQAGEPFSLLFVGRLCRPKGLFDLLHAFSRTHVSEGARLRIVGDGPDRYALEALARRLDIAGKVDFIGTVSSIASFLRESHALILPSHSEGIPRVVMEAFAAGVPVIGTAIPGIEQLVEDQVTGLLVPVADPDALARALERLTSDVGLAQRMALNARMKVTAKHSADRMAHEFREEYRRLCYAI
jgi:glycosyltransferase involved in cell wall biosynthesis